MWNPVEKSTATGRTMLPMIKTPIAAIWLRPKVTAKAGSTCRSGGCCLKSRAEPQSASRISSLFPGVQRRGEHLPAKL